MVDLIERVRKVVLHADGKVSESFYDWQGRGTDFEVRKAQGQHVSVSKVVEIRTYLVSDSGSEALFRGAGFPCILPDRTGVLVVFDDKPSKFDCPDAPWFFGFPHNAAIYNVDGSLRYQLENPHGEGSYIGAVHQDITQDAQPALGVLVNEIGKNPEFLCLVDPESSKLISTWKWIRY